MRLPPLVLWYRSDPPGGASPERGGERGRFGKSVFHLPKVLQAELGGLPYRHRSVSYYLCGTFPAGVHLSYCLHCM